ncbi:CotH kinase family protein [Thalassolituus sp. LLYu03]|uniref:CotH kinase family protein n=1 Tax=Thalassolituus sp. LLYu03 TaxID=3421656 RepID=UPI003D2B1E1C
MNTLTKALYLFLLGHSTLLMGCGAGESASTDNDEFFVPGDLSLVSSDPFDRSRLMIVQIDMGDEDYAALAQEGRTLGDALRYCPDDAFEYTQFLATVNIDGETIRQVSVRKKGFLGSLSAEKPSFKLDFSEFIEGQMAKGLEKMTLNNNRQDPAVVRQCLAYDIYAAAGLNVPRCSWARVYVNGEDMGVYTHVESIGKPFLARTFGNDSGNLYEAQMAEFGEHLNDRFQLKTNKRENNRSDLKRVADVLASADDNWLESLQAQVDIDEFIQLWAADSVLGNWDSTTGNSNNYFLYHDDGDGLFHFIPWGTDASFTGDFILKPGIGPVYKTHGLAYRFYEIPELRQRYETAVANLLSGAASGQALLNRINTITASVPVPDAALNQLKSFISGDEQTPSWGTRLQTAIAAGATDQTDYRYADEASVCNPSMFDLAADFSASNSTDKGTFTFTLPGKATVTANILWASMGPTGVDSISYRKDDSTAPATQALTVIGVDGNSGFKPYVLQLSLEQRSAVTGSHSLQGFANSLMLFRVDSGNDLVLLGTGESGQLTLTEFDPAAGKFSAAFSLGMRVYEE